jgi:hypothetical protein
MVITNAVDMDEASLLAKCVGLSSDSSDDESDMEQSMPIAPSTATVAASTIGPAIGVGPIAQSMISQITKRGAYESMDDLIRRLPLFFNELEEKQAANTSALTLAKEQVRKDKLAAEYAEHREKLNAEYAEHKQKLAAEIVEHKEKLATEVVEHKEKLATENAVMCTASAQAGSESDFLQAQRYRKRHGGVMSIDELVVEHKENLAAEVVEHNQKLC